MISRLARLAPALKRVNQAALTPATTRLARPLPRAASLPTLSARTYVSSHTTGSMTETEVRHFPTDPSLPGENFEPRQTSTSAEVPPDPSKSLKLSPARQALVDDIIALYSCEPTVERVKRYTPDCVYDDQFVYANDRYKMAGQWFGLPYGFKDSTNHGYEVFRNDKDLIQFKNEQVRLTSLSIHIVQVIVLTQYSHGHSKSSPRPPASTPSYHCLWIPRLWTATSSV